MGWESLGRMQVRLVLLVGTLETHAYDKKLSAHNGREMWLQSVQMGKRETFSSRHVAQ